MAIAVTLGCSKEENNSSGDSAPLQSPTVLPVAKDSLGTRSPTLGSEFKSGNGIRACHECHAEIVDAYVRNGMSMSWLSAEKSLASTNYGSAANRVPDLKTGYVYRVAADDGKIVQVEERPDDTRHSIRRTAQYFVGSGKHAQAMVWENQGSLCQLPLAWYSEKNAWGLNPGYELQNRRFNRPVLPGCIACHGTKAQYQSPSPNRYHLPIQDGIGCQRCHGEAEHHIGYWKEGGSGQPPNTAKMIHPGSFDSGRQNDLCLQCHLQGDVVLYRPGQEPLSFNPGDRLRDHRIDLLATTSEPNQLGVASHGARLLQSRCYIASKGQLTCVRCHDPHRPVSDFSRKHFDDRCSSCHQPSDCGRPRPDITKRDTTTTANANLGQEESCVGCHMPQRSSREGIHLVFTDHAILKRVPEKKSATDASSLTLRPNDDVTLVNCWPNDEISPATLGAAYVQLHDTMGPQLPSVERAVKLLKQALNTGSADRETQYWLGSAELVLGNGTTAVQHLSEVVQHDPAKHVARFRLGLALELKGDYAQAIASYEHLLREVPFWVEPYPRLSQLYLFRQDASAAARVVKQQLTYQEDAAAYAQLALAHRLSGGNPMEALTLADRAIQLDPVLPTAYLNRAALQLLSGQNESALSDFQSVLRLDPQNPQARQAVDALRKGQR